MNGWGLLFLHYSSFYVRILYMSMSYFSIFTQMSFIPFPGFVGKQLGWGYTWHWRDRPLDGVGYGDLRVLLKQQRG